MDRPIVPQDKRSKTPEDYHALATVKGLTWLGPYTGKVIDCTTWECHKGHHFQMAYTNLLRRQNGCPECSRNQPEDYHVLAASRGYVWLGPEVRTTLVKTKWRCPEGHEWETTFNALQGCPTCRNARRGEPLRHTVADYHYMATLRDIEWLGPEVTAADQKTWWKCGCGHKWQTRYSTIQRGSGCPKCDNTARGNKRRIKPDQYHAIAESRGFTWLGPEVLFAREKTWWQCPEGHMWFTPYDSLKKGVNCPECLDLVNGRRASKPQRALCEMVGGVLNYKIGRCTVDIAVLSETEKIAIEYDGYFWHAKTESNDYRRAQYMVRRGWKVLIVKSNGQLPTLEQVNDALGNLRCGLEYCEIVLDDWGAGKIS